MDEYDTITSKDILSSGLVAKIYPYDSENIIKIQDKTERVVYEVFFSKLINQIIDNGICLHFSKMIKEINFHDNHGNNTHGIVIKKIDHDLIEMFKTDIDYDEIRSFVFQIVYAIMVINKILDSCHNDVKYLNIMYDDTKEEYIYYKINGYLYRIKTYGKIFYLIDYGRIRSLRKSSDNKTKFCVIKNTDLKQFSKLLLNMYLLEIIDEYNFPFKDDVKLSKHDNLERKRKYLYKKFMKQKLNLNKSKLFVVDEKCFELFEELRFYKDENVFTKLFNDKIVNDKIVSDKNIDKFLINEFRFL